MKRRDFLRHTAYGATATWVTSRFPAAQPLPLPDLPRKFSASDTITLGKTGIQTSRLAMGTGTVGSGHHSHQTALGVKGLSDLLLNGYDHGLRFFDSADSYGSHPHVAEALKFALGLGLLDAFTIGAESKAEQEDLIQRIAAAA